MKLLSRADKKTLNNQKIKRSEKIIQQLRMKINKLRRKAVLSRDKLMVQHRKKEPKSEEVSPGLARIEQVASEVRERVCRLLKSQSQLEAHMEEERRVEREKLLITTEGSFVKDREIVNLKAQVQELEATISNTDKTTNVSTKTKLDMENDAFDTELKRRMQCEICCEGQKSNCCPDCRKGVCFDCYGRLKDNDGMCTSCPYCRSQSDGWPSIFMPRL